MVKKRRDINTKYKNPFVGNRNLIDAANISALASLLTFRRPECTLGVEDGQQVIVHPPEVGFILTINILGKLGNLFLFILF